ncbi:MAG TPA: flagellar motor protein MotB [Vicinamibacterales bacterium]
MKNAPIIIVRKPRRHWHGAHGGAWKVAYADFVTAMMAFFLVLWIVGQSQAVRAGVAGYFRDPGVLDYEHSTGILPGATTGVAEEGPPPLRRDGIEASAADRRALEQKAQVLKEMLARRPEFKSLQNQVEITMTRDGLRIELIEQSDSLFFDTGSAVLKPQTVRLLTAIASEIRSLRNLVVVEGHSDSRRYSTSGTYSNWELSSDRANSARRVMQPALQPGQISEVRGYADTRLRVPEDPYDARNRRVSIIVTNYVLSGGETEGTS